jgi:hypothetical protein
VKLRSGWIGERRRPYRDAVLDSDDAAGRDPERWRPLRDVVILRQQPKDLDAPNFKVEMLRRGSA